MVKEKNDYIEKCLELMKLYLECDSDTGKLYEVFQLINTKSNHIDISPNDKYLVENRLKELLARKRLSQVDVAKQMNVSVKTLNNIVAQKANTSIEVALKLSHILQEPVENIFSLNKI